MTKRSSWVLSLLTLSAMGCESSDAATTRADATSPTSDTPSGVDGTGGLPGESIEEACEHAKTGPFKDVTATTAATDAPDATAEHTLVRVALTDVAGGKGGVVTWASDEAGEVAVFVTRDVPLAVAKVGGAALELEATVALSACEDVPKALVFDFEIGAYTLTFGPTSETSVGIVVEHLGGAHPEGE